MNVSDAELFREILEHEVKRNCDRCVDLLIVPDIAEWAKDRCNNAKGNPIAMSVVDQDSGGWGILIRQSISDQQIRSVIDRIEFSGRLNATKVLNNETLFLRHTILHELAHLENNWDQSREDDCDEWAFERLLNNK